MLPDNRTVFNVYSSHSLNLENNRFVLHDDYNEYVFIFSKLTEKRISADYYIITDELCQTDLPFFFPHSKRVALLLESPIHNRTIYPELLQERFHLILTHREDLVSRGHPFSRLDFSTNFIAWSPSVPSEAFNKHKLVSFIGSISHSSSLSGYSFRKEVASSLAKRSDIDCFGRGIKEIDSKLSGLREYCFSVAMENTRENYYFSEKIIDCILAETVPIYWGCPAIDETFDARGILQFSKSDDLNAILQKVSFEEYERMKPYVKMNKKVCLDLLLDSFDSFLIRCARVIISRANGKLHLKHPLYLSRAAAGCRKFILDF